MATDMASQYQMMEELGCKLGGEPLFIKIS